MILPSVSVIVTAWQRPQDLRRCLIALQQQDHPNLELRLVVDGPTGAQAVNALLAAGWAGGFAANPGKNISVARNIGLGMALGDVVAFIDDDAVAEPTWASRLAAAFCDPTVVAATGYTRGRNGISWQWTAAEVDHLGQDHALPVSGETTLHQGSAQRSVKPVGTNCAFRRKDLLAIGAFDPAYRFYLEDADIGLRLAVRGGTAVVPGAAVHHAFAASDRRRADRVPTDLTEIGASAQVFLRRHAAPDLWPVALQSLREEQAARLASHLAARRIASGEVAALTATLEAGIAEGLVRDLPDLRAIEPASSQIADPGFLRLTGTGPRAGRVIAGRNWQAPRLRREAKALVAQGIVTTLILLSATPRAHRHRLHPDGYWEQTGGLFGPSDREQPRWTWWRFAARIAAESARWAAYRPTN